MDRLGNYFELRPQCQPAVIPVTSVISSNKYKLLSVLCVMIDITDNQDEAWCTTNFLNHAALQLAVVIRAELLEVMQRIELPVSPPAFGCQENYKNIKRALISGFFLKVKSFFS